MTLSSSPARTLQSRLKRGLGPTLASINEFLNFLSHSHRFKLVSHFFFSQFTPSKLAGNSQTRSTVAGALINLRRFDDAESFIAASGDPCRRLWEALLLRRCTDEDSDPEKARVLLRRFLANETDLGISRFPSSSVALSFLIRRFASIGEIGKAVEILDLMAEFEYPFGKFMFGSAVAGLCRNGEPGLAVRIAAVRSDFGLGKSLEARALTCRMVKEGIEPSLIALESELGIESDEFGYAAMIGRLCGARDFGGVSDLLDDIEKKRISLGIVTYNTLIDGLFIRDVEGNMDTIAWNVLIRALFMVGEIDQAREIFEGMGSGSKAAMFLTMVRAYFRLGRLDEAIELLGELHSTLRGRICSDFIETDGPESVERLVESCDFLCDAVVVSLFEKGFPERAFRVLATMRSRGLTLTSKSYYRVIKALIFVGFNEAGSTILSCFLKHYGLGECRVRKALALSLCLSRDLDYALLVVKRMKRNYGTTELPQSLFKELAKRGRAMDLYELLRKTEDSVRPRMDAVDYSRAVNSLCKRGYIAEASELACRVEKRDGISLGIATYNSFVDGLCSQGRIVEAFRVFDSLERLGLAPNDATYSALLDALCRDAHIQDARELFERMTRDGLEPRTRDYNSLIDAHCRVGRVNEAQELIHDLEVKGLEPDRFTVSSMINGFCYNGDMEGALGCFSEFKARKKNVLPDFLGFKYLIRGLSSKGRIEESRSVIREMLLCPSIVELINGVDTGGESEETLEELLTSLCSRGRVREAVSVIDEVASMFFPRWKSGLGVRELVLEPRKGSVKISKRGGFKSYYLRIASLCSQGELQRASKLAKDLLPDLD